MWTNQLAMTTEDIWGWEECIISKVFINSWRSECIHKYAKLRGLRMCLAGNVDALKTFLKLTLGQNDYPLTLCWRDSAVLQLFSLKVDIIDICSHAGIRVAVALLALPVPLPLWVCDCPGMDLLFQVFVIFLFLHSSGSRGGTELEVCLRHEQAFSDPELGQTK